MPPRVKDPTKLMVVPDSTEGMLAPAACMASAPAPKMARDVPLKSFVMIEERSPKRRMPVMAEENNPNQARTRPKVCSCSLPSASRAPPTKRRMREMKMVLTGSHQCMRTAHVHVRPHRGGDEAHVMNCHTRSRKEERGGNPSAASRRSWTKSALYSRIRAPGTMSSLGAKP